jgi:hypothetical protein
VVAVKTGNENSQWAKDLAAAYRSAEFKAVVDSQFAGYAKPAFLQALHRRRTAACRSDCLAPGTNKDCRAVPLSWAVLCRGAGRAGGVALPVLEEYGKSADKQRKGRCKGKYPQRRRSVVCTKLVRKQRLCRC